jgi:hypothetical protein
VAGAKAGCGPTRDGGRVVAEKNLRLRFGAVFGGYLLGSFFAASLLCHTAIVA